MLEEWRDIEGFDDYQVSNLGTVKCKDRYIKTAIGAKLLKERLIALNVQRTGYVTVYMKDNSVVWKTVSVHRLVAITFIPNPEKKREVNHIDGDKANNCLDNLEWATPSENQRHSRARGLNRSDMNPLCRKVRCIQTRQEFNSIQECARYYKVNTETIRKRLNSPVNKRILKGLDFEYIEKEPRR